MSVARPLDGVPAREIEHMASDRIGRKRAARGARATLAAAVGVVLLLAGSAANAADPEPYALSLASETQDGTGLWWEHRLPDTDGPRAVRIVNDGETAATISAITSSSPAFTVPADACLTTIAAGDHCDLTVTFRPPASGIFEGTIEIVSDLPGSPMVVDARGSGRYPDLTLSPWDEVDFGWVAVRESASEYVHASAFESSGPHLPLYFGDISITGPDAEVFEITENLGCDALETLNDDECDLVVTATPQRSGPASATLVIESNARKGPHKIALSVTGRAGSLTVDQVTHDLGDSPLERWTDPVTLTWTNQGDESITIDDWVWPSPFELEHVDMRLTDDTCRESTIAGGASCSVKAALRFDRPMSVELRLGLDTSAAHTDHVTFKATGIDIGLRIHPERLRFSPTRPGRTDELSVTMSRIGTLDLTRVTATVSGTPAISVVSNTCVDATLDAEHGCELVLRFAPNSAGTHSGTLRVTSDQIAPVEEELTGPAIEPLPLRYPERLDLGSIALGAHVDADIDIWSDSHTGFEVHDVAITGSSGFSIRIDQCSPDPLIDGGGCLIRVRAKPTAIGHASGVLNIPTDTGTTLQVPLTMTGRAQELLLAPASLSFSIPRSSSIDREVVVTNVSTDPVTMRGTAVTHGGSGTGTFTVVTNTCRDLVLAPGATCVVGVSYSSDITAGERSGELTIFSARGMYALALTGRTTATGTPGRPGVPEIGTVSIRAVGVPTRVSASWTGRIAWTRTMPVGLDASGTVYSVRVRQGAGAWRTAYKGKRTSADIKLPPGTVTVHVIARNGDLESAPGTTVVSRRLIDLRTAPRHWSVVRDTRALGGRVLRATTGGAKLSYVPTSRASGVAVVVRGGSRKGVFDVVIDGRKVARVTVPAGKLRSRKIAWQRYGSPGSISRIEIRAVSGTVEIDGLMLAR
jgi:hypothetical protein